MEWGPTPTIEPSCAILHHMTERYWVEDPGVGPHRAAAAAYLRHRAHGAAPDCALFAWKQ